MKKIIVRFKMKMIYQIGVIKRRKIVILLLLKVVMKAEY